MQAAIEPLSLGSSIAAALRLVAQFVALLDQPVELLLLLGDAVGVALLVAGARIGGGLFDQLADVVARDGDAALDVRQRQYVVVAHVTGLRLMPMRRGRRLSAIGEVSPRLPVAAIAAALRLRATLGRGCIIDQRNSRVPGYPGLRNQLGLLQRRAGRLDDLGQPLGLGHDAGAEFGRTAGQRLDALGRHPGLELVL